MTRLVFVPYKNGLNGLGLVKEKLKELGHKVLEIKVVGSKYKQKKEDIVIKWGTKTDKIEQYTKFSKNNVQHANWSFNIEDAKVWVSNKHKVICRTILNGHGGAGIVVAKAIEELVDAPLYTVYTPKKREFRVHIVISANHLVPYVAEKKQRLEGKRPEGNEKYIRNHENGWVFCKNPENVPPEVLEEAYKAVQALGYQFGAVDIGWHPETGPCVYEVNSAPGVDNTTAEWYAQQFTSLVK